MININSARMFCSEPIELIENYNEAVNDKTQLWHCHHIWETMLGYSKQELIDIDEYYGIPACNLVFLPQKEHVILHHKGKKYSEETRRKISELKKGNTAFKGKHHTEESRKKISESSKGKKMSEEARKKMSDGKKGKMTFDKHPKYKKICPLMLYKYKIVDRFNYNKIGEILNVSNNTIKYKCIKFNIINSKPIEC